MLELAFRSLAWLWSLEMFAAAAAHEDEAPWIVDLLLALDRQLTHIEQNLSHYFSPNTHLSGEALALYVAGCALPELGASARRVALGRQVLIQEATRQVRVDGGHAELSAHYHRYSTDFYLLAARVASLAGDPAATVFEQAARAQARYLRAICDDRGIRPQLGDDDGGQLFPMCGTPVDDCRPTLAIAAVLLRAPSLRIGPVPEEARWLCGAEARSASLDTLHSSSSALTASGYYVSRTAQGDHLVFDAGPHGFLNGGHAHADALSLTLTIGGRPVLIDPGTATYTMDAELRDRFRSTPMHNTVVLDGRSQSEPLGAFQWITKTTADAPIWRQASESDYVEGTHAAYAPHRHTRGVLAVHGVGWWILDHLLGPAVPRSFALALALPPGLACHRDRPPPLPADPARRHAGARLDRAVVGAGPWRDASRSPLPCLRRRGASPGGPGSLELIVPATVGDLHPGDARDGHGTAHRGGARRDPSRRRLARQRVPGALEGGRDGHAGRDGIERPRHPRTRRLQIAGVPPGCKRMRAWRC